MRSAGLALAALTVVATTACGSDSRASSSMTTTSNVTTTSSAAPGDPNAEPPVPTGYSLDHDGPVSILTREAAATTTTEYSATTQLSTTQPSSGIGDAMSTTRRAEPIRADRGASARTVRVTFACQMNHDDVIDAVSYQLVGARLVVSARVTGRSGGRPCAAGEGITIVLPLDQPWVDGTAVVAGDLPVAGG